MIDFSKIKIEKKELIIHPIAIFSSLPNKSKKYNGYLRNVQGEVLNQWFEVRNYKDNIIKMNTGSGKTTVSLLILQSCMNEKNENAVYVVPDNYLIQQVKEEAKDLGIKVVEDENNIEFLKNKAILIITIQKLVNGKTVFNEKNKIDNIIIDDVHACIDVVEQQFIIRIHREEHAELYNELFLLFKKELERQNHVNTLNIEDKVIESNPMLVPFWEVKEKQKSIICAINKHRDEEKYTSIMFPFEFLNDMIQYCNICISSNNIEISPDCFPMNKISSFNNANRRIFVSATLKNDGHLINCFNLDIKNINQIITPNQALDIGNRMILYPQVINPNIKDEEMKYYLKKISIDKRVVVIVPSHNRANFWNDVADRIFDKKNIEEIKKYEKGLDILVNRYDGIDLKDDLCSYLVIDGLPQTKNLFDQIKEIILRDIDYSIMKKMQKIEQGMGRGVRSNQDKCAVMLMGKKILNSIYNKNAINYFSASTKTQYMLSEEIAEQLTGESLGEIIDTFKLCLESNEEWLEIVNKALSKIEVSNKINFIEKEIKLNQAFNIALRGNYSLCVDIIQNIVNVEQDETLKGFYMFYLAKYTNFINPVSAQQIMLSAKKYNNDLLIPLQGYDYVPRKVMKTHQTTNILNLIEKKFNGDCKSYRFFCEGIFSNLIFEKMTYKQFEKNINDLASCLGFLGSMPETECGNGPDNLWDIGNNNYFIIECKNEAITNFISKSDCGQLCVSTNWVKEKYGQDKKYTSILIHKSKTFDIGAVPNDDFRIITNKELEKIENRVISFCEDLTRENSITEELISELLRKNSLEAKSFIENNTTFYDIRK